MRLRNKQSFILIEKGQGVTSSTLTIGTAPDSWGVWFPSDPEQVPASQFLAEVAAAGYEAIELGPFGYLPTDPAELKEALDQYNLSVLAGTVFSHLHLPGAWDYTWKQVTDVAALTQAMGGEHIVVIPEPWRDHKTGEPQRGPESVRRAVDLADRPDRRTRPADPRGVRTARPVPQPRRQPRRLPAGDRTLPRGHEPGVRQPLPRHRTRRLLRRRLRRADHQVSGADRLRPPQAGQPGDRGRGPRQGSALPRSRADGRHDRTAARTAGDAARCWRRWPGSAGTSRDHRARPLPVRARRARCRSRSGPRPT